MARCPSRKYLRSARRDGGLGGADRQLERPGRSGDGEDREATRRRREAGSFAGVATGAVVGVAGRGAAIG